MILLEWWAGLQPWLRMLVALIITGIGGLICYYLSLRLGIVPLALGVAMVFFGGKSDSEKKGYKF